MYSAAISHTQSTSELDQAEQLCELHSPMLHTSCVPPAGTLALVRF